MSDGQTNADVIRSHFADLISGDEEAIAKYLHEDFVQEWPQTGEQVRGRQACLHVFQNYPGGPPQVELGRISGEGDHWVVEGISRYPDGNDYHIASVIEMRDGVFIHQTDYFGPTFPAPDWRKQWVEPLGS